MIIDQLPLLGGDVQGTDEFPIERGTTTYKTTQAALIKTATDAAAAAQAAAAAAQAAADDAQDTADEANAKGLPPGGTAGQVLTKADSADYSASWEDPSGGDVTADMLGIVITGNSTPVGAAVGQYVIVKASTISGITDGLYTAAQVIPANTAIDSTYLTAVSDGGFNDLQSDLKKYAKSSGMISLTPASGFSLASGWGSLRFYWRGNVGFLYASGLRSSSNITSDTVFASGIPYSASYFLHAFPISGSNGVGRVISGGTQMRINGIPANTDIFFGFSFPLDI